MTGDDGVGIDHVAPALGHLFSVLAQDDALVKKLSERFTLADDTFVKEYFVPESRVEEM